MLGVEWQRQYVPGVEGFLIGCGQRERSDLVLYEGGELVSFMPSSSYSMATLTCKSPCLGFIDIIPPQRLDFMGIDET